MENYDLNNSEGGNRKIIFIAVAVVAIGVLAVGGYYIYTKNNNNIPVTISSPVPTIDFALDSDSDTIPDVVEKAIGTDLNKADTDNDSYADLDEIKNGYSPIIAGADGKYTPEELQNLKNKIKAADESFFEKEFGTSAESGNPKTYRNEYYSFEVDYPSGWHIVDGTIMGGSLLISTFTQEVYDNYYGTAETEKLGDNYGAVYISYSNELLDKKMESFKMTLDKLSKAPSGSSKIGKIIVGDVNIPGVKGYKLNYQSTEFARIEKGEGNISIIYLISDKDNKGTIKFEGNFRGQDKAIYEQYSNEFDQAFSSFKFTDKN